MRFNVNKARLQILGDLEREVMNVVWDHESVTVRDVFEALQKKRSYAYTTIMTIMDRLFAKKVLTRKKTDNTYSYSSLYDREEFFKRASRQLLQDLRRVYGDVAIVQFVDTLEEIDPRLLEKLKVKFKKT